MTVGEDIGANHWGLTNSTVESCYSKLYLTRVIKSTPAADHALHLRCF